MDGGALVLKGLRAEDSGAYTCVAHNAAGEDARLHTVSVLGEQRRGEAGGGSALPGLLRPGHCGASTRGIWRGDAGAGMPETWFQPQPCPHCEPGHHTASLGLCILS